MPVAPRPRNRLLAITRTTIPYVKELRPHVGSVTAAIMMQQLEYWHDKYPDGFYKFLAPCDHPLYKPGQSWTEELGFSLAEVRGALTHLCNQHKSRTEFANADDAFDGHFYCAVYSRVDHLTTYYRNDEAVGALLDRLVSGGDGGQSREMRKVHFPKCDNDTSGNAESASPEMHNSHLVNNTEITTEITQTKTPSVATDGPLSKQTKRCEADAKDGLPAEEWDRRLIEHCYGGTRLPEWGQQTRPLRHLREHYPLDVVLKFHDERMRAMRDRRTLTPKVLALDIASWLGLRAAMQEWERGHGRTAIDQRCAADGASVGQDGASVAAPREYGDRTLRALAYINTPPALHRMPGRYVRAGGD